MKVYSVAAFVSDWDKDHIMLYGPTAVATWDEAKSIMDDWIEDETDNYAEAPEDEDGRKFRLYELYDDESGKISQVHIESTTSSRAFEIRIAEDDI